MFIAPLFILLILLIPGIFLVANIISRFQDKKQNQEEEEKRIRLHVLTLQEDLRAQELEAQQTIHLTSILDLALPQATRVFQKCIADGKLVWDNVENPNVGKLTDIMQTILLQGGDTAVICRRWIWKLYKTTGRVPDILFLSHVECSRNAISGGGFGDIYRGRWNRGQVALKVARFGYQEPRIETVKRSFYREALFWFQLHHPNILPLFGVNETLFPGQVCLVCPWMAHGNLNHFIESHPTFSRRKLMCDAASGMDYLHSLEVPLVHGDIKGANILVSDEEVAMLCDFGLTTFADGLNITTTSTNQKWSLRWAAPEIMYSEDASQMRKTTASDVYAFGMTLWEAYSSAIPFSKLSDPQVLLKATSGDRPAKTDAGEHPNSMEVPEDIWKLITECWGQQALKRPESNAIVEVLRRSIDEPS